MITINGILNTIKDLKTVHLSPFNNHYLQNWDLLRDSEHFHVINPRPFPSSISKYVDILFLDVNFIFITKLAKLTFKTWTDKIKFKHMRSSFCV